MWLRGYILQFWLIQMTFPPHVSPASLKRDHIDVLIPYVGPLYISTRVCVCVCVCVCPLRACKHTCASVQWSVDGWVEMPPLPKPNITITLNQARITFKLSFICFCMCVCVCVCVCVSVCASVCVRLSVSWSGYWLYPSLREFLSAVGNI